jgi:N-acetylglutamate synthase
MPDAASVTAHPGGDVVAAALGATWARLASTLRAGWARESGGVHALVTGVPVPFLNGVWALGGRVDAATVITELDAVARAGVPFCLQARPAWRDGAAAIAAARGMLAEPEIPLMALAGPVAAPAVDGLGVRVLDAGETTLHCAVAGPAFGAPPEVFAQIITSEVVALTGVRGYVGEIGGEPVVTAMTITIGDGVGVFNVATLPHHRRRGYGAAITARAISDARRDGASWAWLQSSDAGYGVYERLGFATVERWPCWVAPGA